MTSYAKIVREFAKKIFALPRGIKKGKSSNDFNRQEDWLKEEYIECVETILSGSPIRCPVYQCGSHMRTVIRKPPKDLTCDDEYPGDSQTPDLICTDCRAQYRYVCFKKRRKLKK